MKQHRVPGDRDEIDWATVGLVVFAFVLLWLIIAVSVPGPP